MGKSCVLTPRVKSGEVSPLYTLLKEYFQSAGDARYWYRKATSPLFSEAFPSVKLDLNGEPSLLDLVNKCGLKEALKESEFLHRLEKHYNTEATKDYNNVMALEEKAANFNKQSLHNKDFVAVVEEDASKVYLKIKPSRAVTLSELKEMEYNVALNRKLENLLNSWGIGISNLSKLEEKLGLNGLTDFSLAKKAAKGIQNIIRLAKGKKGTRALPEEFAHFAIEAMEDNTLKSRSLKALENELILRLIFGEEFQRYYDLYEGNLETMAREALGKLVAKALLDPNVSISDRLVFLRYLKTLKDFYGKYDDAAIDTIMAEVMLDVYELANNLINDRYKVMLENIKYTDKLALLNEKIERDKAILLKIIELETKRLLLYGSNEEFAVRQADYIELLKTTLSMNMAMEGIYDYLTNSNNILGELFKRLDLVIKTPQSVLAKFETLRNIKNYLASYGVIMDLIHQLITEASLESDNRFKDKLGAILDQDLKLIGDLGKMWTTIAQDEFGSFLESFTENGMVKMMKDGLRVEMPVRELLQHISNDISFVDRWIDSMADSTDPILQLYNSIVQKQKGEAKLEINKIVKDIQAETIKLELSGTKDTSFVAERDSKGNVTGRFLDEIWWGKYFEDKKAFFEYLDEKYGSDTSVYNHERGKEIEQWYEDHTFVIAGVRMPRKKAKDGTTLYINPTYENLTDAERDYLKFIKKLKTKLDRPLPYSRDNLLPQVRKSFAQRLMENPNKGKQTWESIKDIFVVREDDMGMGNLKTLVDFDGNEVMRLPTYFTQPLSDLNDLSTDVASTMMLYAYMSVNFDKMNEVVDALEIGRDVLLNREVGLTIGDNVRVETVRAFGHEFQKPYTKSGEATRFMLKLNSFMEMQVYDKQMKDEGTYGNTKISLAKTVNFMLLLTSLGTTAVSLLTGVANLSQNWVTSTTEAASGLFFTKKELLKADGHFFKELFSFIRDIGARVKTNKLELFDEMFDVMQDHRQSIQGAKMYRKNRLLRLFNSNLLYLFTHMGDVYTYNRVAIAIAENYKMLYNGEEVSLWDVLEVDYRDENNHALGATLKIKDGATKLDGTEFTKADIVDLSNKMRGILNRLFGIYNSQDKIAARQYSVGRAFFQYRDWMRPLYLTRFGKGRYNHDLQDYVEGYYRSLGRLMGNIVKDLRQGQFDIAKLKDNLTEMEKGNIKKALTEITIFTVVNILLSQLFDSDDDDDMKTKPWGVRLANYTLLRLRTDMGTMMPTPTMVKEAQKLIDDPFAMVSTIERILNLYKLATPSAYEKEITSGIYKGYMEYEKVLIDVLPFRRAVVNAMDPSQPAKWYK